MEKRNTKTRMTAAERKRKSRENKFKKMTEEREAFKEAEKERIRKTVQSHRSKKEGTMTPEDLRDYKMKEASIIKVLRNKKV